jgi:hypothetical protein
MAPKGKNRERRRIYGLASRVDLSIKAVKVQSVNHARISKRTSQYAAFPQERVLICASFWFGFLAFLRGFNLCLSNARNF